MNQNQIENIFNIIYQIEPEITREQYVEIAIACGNLTMPEMDNEVKILYNSFVAKWNKEQLNGEYRDVSNKLLDHYCYNANATYATYTSTDNATYNVAYAVSSNAAADNAAAAAAAAAANAAADNAAAAADADDATYAADNVVAVAVAAATYDNADIISAIETVIPRIRLLITF